MSTVGDLTTQIIYPVDSKRPLLSMQLTSPTPEVTVEVGLQNVIGLGEEICGGIQSNFTTAMYMPPDVIYYKHPEEIALPWNYNGYFFPIVVCYFITFVIGVTGNAVVVTVMAGDRSSRNVTGIFLVSLAVADLLLLVICAPLDVAHYFVVKWDTSGAICKMAAYAEMLSALASVLNLVAVTLERFVVIVFPIRSRSVCTMSNCKKIMIGVWIISMLLALPVIATKETLQTTFTNCKVHVTTFICRENSSKASSVAIFRLVTLFVLPSVVMIVCYGKVIMELWISTKTMDQLTNTVSECFIRAVESRSSISTAANSPGQLPDLIQRNNLNNDIRDVKKERQQVIKMLLLVVILFLLCWGPRLIMEIIVKCCLNVFNHGVYTTRLIFYLLPFVHSCLNPIVYSFMSTKFRRRMSRCFSRSCLFTCLYYCCGRSRAFRYFNRIKSTSSSISRNGTVRLGSTYTFISYTPSVVGSPTGEPSVATRVLDVDTLPV